MSITKVITKLILITNVYHVYCDNFSSSSRQEEVMDKVAKRLIDHQDVARRIAFSIIGVTETWINNSSINFSLPGYSFYQENRVEGGGGGVGLFVRTESGKKGT